MLSNTDDFTSSKKYPQWHNIAAGAIAGAGARFLTAPLDLLVSDQRTGASLFFFLCDEIIIESNLNLSLPLFFLYFSSFNVEP